MTLSADGSVRSIDVHVLLLALHAGADRFPVWCDNSDPAAAPALVPQVNCHLGRVLAEEPSRGLVAEVLLDRPLRLGETVVAQYRVVWERSCVRQREFVRGLVGGVRELGVEVRFDPAVLPASVEHIAVVEGAQTSRALPVTESIQLVLLDRPAGSYGLRWVW